MRFSIGNTGKDKIRQLSDYISQSSHIVAITGAGISVSGGGVTYGQLSRSTRTAGDSEDGEKAFLRNYLHVMFHYNPSFSHYVLRDLEKAGKLTGIITTNVDCMHTIAGSENVAEIQGSLQVNCCPRCDHAYYGYEIWNQKELPLCESCGSLILPWPLYSHIGLWNPDVRKARSWIAKADLILAIGTRGNYGNAYWNDRNSDAIIVQINPGHTFFDRFADLNIRETSDDAFRKLKEWQDKNRTGL